MCLVQARRNTNLLVPQFGGWVRNGFSLDTGMCVDVDTERRREISVGSEQYEVFFLLKTPGRIAVLCKDVVLVQ